MVHGANMGPTWVLSSPGGPHVDPMNLAIWVIHTLTFPHLGIDGRDNAGGFKCISVELAIQELLICSWAQSITMTS